MGRGVQATFPKERDRARRPARGGAEGATAMELGPLSPAAQLAPDAAVPSSDVASLARGSLPKQRGKGGRFGVSPSPGARPRLGALTGSSAQADPESKPLQSGGV